MRLLISTSPGARPASRSKALGLTALGPAPGSGRRGIFAVDAADGLGQDNAWDAVHEALDRRKDKSSPLSAGFDWIEPDVEHAIFLPPADAQGGEGRALFGRKPLPGGPFGWHLGEGFSQLAKARDSVRFAPDGPRVRIGHIDTGWDPDHSARPRNVNNELARNFIEGGKDARDPGKGRPLIDMPGHGTGTIGILAGGRVKQDGFDGDIGGCPEAEIVPMRIARSVILFRTSELVEALRHAIACKCDVLSMSMGGAPSELWAQLVNDLYRAGIVYVAAAGNNIDGVVTPELVYPARFGRVIAACGAMFDYTPYHDLPGRELEGNAGPDEVMDSAVAAFTPNIPWPVLGGKTTVDPAGRGTSAATPQVAAAAALYVQKYRAELAALPEGWMRVESVRRALFQSASREKFAQWRKFFGNGTLRAFDALAVPPGAAVNMTPPDDATNAILKALPGPFGVSADERVRYFALEAAQLRASGKNPMKDGSKALRAYLERSPRPVQVPGADNHAAAEIDPNDRFRSTATPPPAARRLRVFAFDPSLSRGLDQSVNNEVELKVRWESNLQAGPCGEYIDVIDVDPPSQCCYEPVDLNDPHLVAESGLAPSEGNPKFHQQMVYAVAMRTVEVFERALGRPVFWASPAGSFDFNPRLRIYPHALREANAYYSPDKAALLFGYFPADLGAAGGMVFTCLSHDVVAHETTHAILDGMHRRFQIPTNPDALAFHEAFADIVALFSRFSLPGVLETEIARTRGDLEQESTLGKLAQQFGAALGQRNALRTAIGELNEKGEWTRVRPDPSRYRNETEPHLRGSILVSAVFDTFLAIYRKRTADLVRIASQGSGILRPGAIHPDLVSRLAHEAAKTARQILHICVRALDYCPPVDLTFGEYLRALITADFDLVPDDQTGFRAMFSESFRLWGIYPRDVRSLSPESLLWSTTHEGNRQLKSAQGDRLIELLRAFHSEWSGLVPKNESDLRREIYGLSAKHAGTLHEELLKVFDLDGGLAKEVGLDPAIRGRQRKTGEMRMRFEVHSVRVAMRPRADGTVVRQVIVVLTQGRDVQLESGEVFKFHGGSTIIVDLNASENQLRYVIRKNINSESRERRTREFLESRHGAMGARAVYLSGGIAGGREPFALLHRHSGEAGGY